MNCKGGYMGNINDLITKNQFSQVIKNIQSGINTVTSRVQKTAESLDLGSVTNHVTSTIGNFFDSNTKNVTREALPILLTIHLVS